MNADTQSNALASTGSISLTNPTTLQIFPSVLNVIPMTEPVDNLRNSITQGYATLYDGAPFNIIMAGTCTPSRSDASLTIGLYSNNGQGFEPNLFFSSAVAVPALVRNWYLRADCMWDSSSQTLNGTIQGFIAGTQVSLVALATSTFNTLTSFTIGASLSTANNTPSLVTLNAFHLNLN